MEIPVNKRIELILKNFKINQKSLAEKAGLSENTISNAKKGKNVPNVDFFNSLYKAFPTLNPKWLYLGVGNMEIGIGVEQQEFLSDKEDLHRDCYKIINSLQIEIQYLKIQIKDKEEIIKLLKE